MSLLLVVRPLTVKCRAGGLPHIVYWRGRRQSVVVVLNRWRVDTHWWDEPVSFDYFKLLLEDGTLLLLVHDSAADIWVVRRIYG